jgi:hypothetical protein
VAVSQLRSSEWFIGPLSWQSFWGGINLQRKVGCMCVGMGRWYSQLTSGRGEARDDESD